MAQQSRIRIPATAGRTTDGSSYDSEMAGVMWGRARLIFLVGIVASSVVFIFNRIYGLEPISPPLGPWK